MYSSGKPIGWCAIEPREKYPVLENSRALKRIDEKPVWSITCFFIAKQFRRKGLSVKLINAAVEYAVKQGADIVEGYPTEPKTNLPAPFIWTGTASAFKKAGFIEAARRSKARSIVRYFIDTERTKCQKS
ncbi:MAG: GNAT family N-acetyltransferase [Candidatus Thermoplasmatota archaeon]|nr:GNAT family N-acetyltransferase [Candidatus Thermoplasmatota archaeon]